jgi:hypothetical protein
MVRAADELLADTIGDGDADTGIGVVEEDIMALLIPVRRMVTMQMLPLQLIRATPL